MLHQHHWQVVVTSTLVGGFILATSSEDTFRQCDRQCRWRYGFYQRHITGEPVSHSIFSSKMCQCFRDGQKFGALQPWESLKAWNESFWCGDFKTSLVCALPSGDAEIGVTITREQAKSRNLTILHCGQCAACSNLHDLSVLDRTKKYITSNMTACSTAFAKPKFLGGHQNVTKLIQCLHESAIDFSSDGRSWKEPAGKSTCMDCWTDNIQCDSVQCKLDPDCILKFLNPHNSGDYAGCLKCDETHCGPEFIRCAGANRRSSGIVSDIHRVSDEICTVGYYHNRAQ